MDPNNTSISMPKKKKVKKIKKVKKKVPKVDQTLENAIK